MSNIVAAASGGVAARDILSVDVGHDRDVLANGQVQKIILVGKCELVPVVIYEKSKKSKQGFNTTEQEFLKLEW